MRARRIVVLLTLALFLLPALASAGERSHRRGLLPQVDLTQIREILVRPWLLLWRAPLPEVNKGGGTMDPNGNPCDGDD